MGKNPSKFPSMEPTYPPSRSPTKIPSRAPINDPTMVMYNFHFRLEQLDFLSTIIFLEIFTVS